MADASFDVVVVGSGASAVHAAWPLAEAGLRVAMLDVGNRDEIYAPLIPPKSFSEIRRSDPDQHRYFLGDNFEGISLSRIGLGAQLTPPRMHIIRETEGLAPLVGDNFSAMQSLALGGLAAGWGASTIPFSEGDFASWPIGRRDLQPHYDVVAGRIGLCGAGGDLAPLIGVVDGQLPPADLDSNGESVYLRYQKRRRFFERNGFHVARAWLAVATVPFRGRGPLLYHDMEFWSDGDRSVYRPRYTVEELRGFAGFSYHDRLLVERFEENRASQSVTITCLNLASGLREQVTARRLVLAAGALGTARIVLRSLNRYDQAVPLLTNPYTYFPSLNVLRLGQPTRDARHGLTQLTMFFEPDGKHERMLQVQMYSYRSLLLFKLVKESPLARRESLRIMRRLYEYFVIFGVFHEDRSSPGNFLKLSSGGGAGHDVLKAHFRLPAEVVHSQRAQEKRIVRILIRLGCLPLKAMRLEYGSSIHYAGCFPMAPDGPPLTTFTTGRLRAAPFVYLADGSTFPHLPAKSLTFTLMANANRVGTSLCEELEKSAVRPTES
ncbi:MAG TPA: GMC oxidoreductase [Candidatus Acidoferrum sp.]|nr:GMC oxidoreductase [Candidatus Acidoferrum sp.]